MIKKKIIIQQLNQEIVELGNKIVTKNNELKQRKYNI